MPRKISPPRSEVPRIYPLLSRSEWLVLDFLDRNLPDKWEIYVQPALNGMRPDFVLLHDELGVGVVEVKHWRINSGRFARHDHGSEGTPVLRYRFGGREINMARSNPIEQIDRYRQGILDLYCPRLGKRGVQVVFGAVIFTDTLKEAAEDLLKPWILRAKRSSYPSNCVISGSAELQSREIMKCIPWAWKPPHASKEQAFNPDMAADLRTWLEEPDSAREARTPLRFSTPQKEVITRLTRRIRVRGAAGSGKSFVLVARAARLAGEGKRVLVLTFNLTLIAYLRQLCFRIPDAPANFHNKVTWLSFHLWIRRMCEDTGAIDEYRAVWAKHRHGRSDEDAPTEGSSLKLALERLIPLLRSVLLRVTADRCKYDAILIDEGQDFDPAWVAAITLALKQDGELFLVRDVTQDLYGQAQKQTEPAWRGCGFSGPWTRLGQCYRTPRDLLEHLRIFCTRYLSPEDAELPDPQLDLPLTPCELRWRDCHDCALAEGVFQEANRMVTVIPGFPSPVYPDITVLVPDENSGLKIADLLAAKGVPCTDTFTRGEWPAARRAKMAFRLSKATIKLTTIHSFKGMETRALILALPVNAEMPAPKLVYTALSRLKDTDSGSYLTVVSVNLALSDYGRTWPGYSCTKPTEVEFERALDALFLRINPN